MTRYLRVIYVTLRLRNVPIRQRRILEHLLAVYPCFQIQLDQFIELALDNNVLNWVIYLC